MNAACSYAELGIPLFPGIPLTVLDDVPAATVDPLPIPPTLPPDPPECVARYAQYLKDKYKSMSTLPDGDWPPSLGRQYTRLAMIMQERELPGGELVATMERDYLHGNIDNIVKRKKAVQLPEIFLPPEDGGQQLKILMDGAPGVGKSTLSRKICKDWASGQLLQQYHLVLLLPLRQASIREANSIEDLIKTDSPDLQQQVVQHLQETSGEHILLILDGYDELSNEDRTQGSLFLDIVRGDKFPRCSVLVTSRPYASDYLQQLESVNRHVEVLGFTEEQIEHCILENIPDKTKATELVQSLKERQDIASLCYIPLNCAIVLHVYKMAQCTLPHSLTKLYETFIVNALKRHAKITGNDPRSTRRLNTLKNLPEPLQQQLNALSTLAYNGLVADKMVFSTEDLEAVLPDSSDLNIDSYLLGLMTVIKEFTSTGEELSYQFLHLTIQEFLAARWVASQLSASELWKFFQDHLREQRYQMVLLFLAGISQLNFHCAENIFHENLDFLNQILAFSTFNYFLFLAHLIFESQNLSLFRNLASTLQGAVLSAVQHSISPFDCLVLAHFLAWCDCSLKLDLCVSGLTSQSLEIIHRVNTEHHGTTQIEEVNLSYNHHGLMKRLSLLPTIPMFERTRVLIVNCPQYPDGVSCDQVELHCLLNLRHLTTLEVSVKEIPVSCKMEYSLSLGKFVKVLRTVTKLQVLRYWKGNIDSHNAINIFRSLEHNTSLNELNLSENSQLAEGNSEAVGCAIERLLNVNRTLKVLNLSGCNITDAIVKHILTGLTKNTSLVTLHMGSPTLSVSCAVSLFQQMTTHPTLSITVGEVNVLGVGMVKIDRGSLWCVIGDLIPENCVEFLRALNNSGLKVSKLNVQDLTDQTAEHFAVGLTEYRSFQALNLQHYNITCTGAVSIFRSLEHNTSLEELDLSWNRQLAKGDSEAVGCAIAKMLKINKTLKVLCLTNSGLDTVVATHIFRSLEHNTSLEELDLSWNSQLAEDDSEAVGCAIERILNVNRTLAVLNLSGCNITDPVAKHIVTGLTKNTSLVTLDMESSKLSGSCAVSLFQQMTTHPTLSTVGEVNVLGVGMVKMDRGSLWCVIGDLIPEDCVEFFRALNNSGLKVSKLNVQDLTDQTAEHFAVGLTEYRSFQALKLQHCNITCTGAVSIFKSLEHNTSLEELDLSWNSQLAEDDSEAVGCAIERILNVNRTLAVLNLSGCNITDPVAKHIVTGLTKNTSLVTLVMGSSTLSVSCAVSLFQQMTTHPTLSTVGEVNVLGVGRVKMDRGSLWCVIGDLIPENCVEFFRALNNSGLKVSKLNVQDLTDQTAEHFAVGLTEYRSFQALKLKHCNISSTGAVSIFRSLEHNTNLEILDLSWNWQLAEGDSEAVGCAIAKMLKINKTLKVLCLTNCGLETVVATHIFRSLEHNTSLEELDLSWNSQLAEDDSEAVGCAIERILNVNRTLAVLNLSGCNITDPVAKHIVTGLTKNTSLVTLDMESSKLSGSCAVSLFQQMTTHPTLSTVGAVNVLGVGMVKMDRGSLWCVIGDLIPENCVEFFRAINNSGLKVSKLNVQDLTDQTAEHFAVGLTEYRSFQALKLQHYNITSTGAVSIFRSLEHNTSLEELDLSWNSQLAEGDSEAVGCAIAKMLKINQTLKVLRLTNCGLDTVVATHIFRSLEHNTSLEKLDLSENSQLSEDDSESVGCAIERILNVNRTLEVLNLSGCNITDPVAKHILTGLTKNTSLVTLHMGSPTLSVSCAVSLFQQMTTHPTLSITVGEVNVLGVGKVKKDRESLWCVIGDLIPEDCVEFLRALNNSGLKVSKLNVQDLTNQTTEHFAVGLTEYRSFQALKLKHCNISSTGAVSIFRSLEHNTNLEILDLSGNWQLAEGDSEAVGCAIAKMLKINKTLKVLCLTNCGLDTVVATHIFRSLEHNTSLEELDLSWNSQLAEDDSEAVGCAIERILNVNRTLAVLNLSGCNITDPVAKHILTGLTKNTSLVTLHMGSPTLSVSCAVSLFQQMTTHPTLSITVGEVNVLGVGKVKKDRESLWCVIGDLIPEDCVEFFRAINNSGLKVSKLNVQDLTDQTAEHFAVGLTEYRSFQALNLQHYNITCTGAVSIFRSLEHNTSLEELDLSENWQLAEGDSEAVGCAIAKMLKINKTLKLLCLTNCGLDTVVATHIFRSLEHNTSLEELDLSWNSQLAEDDSEAVGCAIERILNVNRTLAVLNLSGCNITDPVAKHILTGLTKNTSLVTLHMGSPTLSVSCAVSLFQQMTTHPTLSITVGEVNVLGVGKVKKDRESLWCVIGDLIPEDYVEFFRALNSSGLKFSNLNVENLTDQTVEHFAVGLAEYRSFQALKLKHCNISSTGAVSIFRSLEHNTSLEILDLHC